MSRLERRVALSSMSGLEKGVVLPYLLCLGWMERVPYLLCPRLNMLRRGSLYHLLNLGLAANIESIVVESTLYLDS